MERTAVTEKLEALAYRPLTSPNAGRLLYDFVLGSGVENVLELGLRMERRRRTSPLRWKQQAPIAVLNRLPDDRLTDWAYKSGDGEPPHASDVDDTTDVSVLRHLAFASYRGDSRPVAADATVAD